MNLGETYEYVNYVLNRDQLGDPASPEQFNLLLKRFNILHYNTEYQSLIRMSAEKGLPFAEIMYESGAMKRFEESKSWDIGVITTNYFAKPDDYKRSLTLSIFSENSWRPVEILAPKSFDNATKNVMRNPVGEFPIAREYSTRFFILPYVNKVRLDYIRIAEDPFFDYCLDEGDGVVFMPKGSYLQSGTKDPPYTFALYDAENALLIDGVIAKVVPDLTSPPLIFSDTVELDWDDEFKEKITEDIISACSTRSREFDMVDKSKIDKQEQS